MSTSADGTCLLRSPAAVEQTVVFDEADNPAEVQQHAAESKSTLTAFFEAIQAGQDIQTARSLLYQEFPQKFVFQQETKKWTIRQRGFALGRMYYTHPTAGERFYLRLLLTVVAGNVFSIQKNHILL